MGKAADRNVTKSTSNPFVLFLQDGQVKLFVHRRQWPLVMGTQRPVHDMWMTFKGHNIRESLRRHGEIMALPWNSEPGEPSGCVNLLDFVVDKKVSPPSLEQKGEKFSNKVYYPWDFSHINHIIGTNIDLSKINNHLMTMIFPPDGLPRLDRTQDPAVVVRFPSGGWRYKSTTWTVFFYLHAYCVSNSTSYVLIDDRSYRCILMHFCEVHVYVYTVYNTDKKLMDIWVYLDIFIDKHIYPEFNTRMYPIINAPREHCIHDGYKETQSFHWHMHKGPAEELLLKSRTSDWIFPKLLIGILASKVLMKSEAPEFSTNQSLPEVSGARWEHSDGSWFQKRGSNRQS